jgi:hypothetical protein
MVQEKAAIGLINKRDKWNIRQLKRISFQKNRRGDINPANASIPGQSDLRHRRKSIIGR